RERNAGGPACRARRVTSRGVSWQSMPPPSTTAAARWKVVRRRRATALALLILLLAGAVGAAIALADSDKDVREAPRSRATHQSSSGPGPPSATSRPTNIYAHTLAGMLTPITRRARYLVYVPDSQGDGVYVINPT